MKYGGRVMLAVAGGYVLGRTKKMKLAIMLAGMASGNKIARDPTQLLQQGTRLVQSNPQLSALSDQVRGRLVDAGKGIAVAVVSKQMESLTDRLGERTERLSGRLDERIGSLRAVRSGQATGEADLADEEHVDDWADEDRADQDRAARVQPRSRRTTSTRTSGAGHRGAASSPKRRDGTSAPRGSDGPGGNTARHHAAGGSQGGGRNA